MNSIVQPYSFECNGTTCVRYVVNIEIANFYNDVEKCCTQAMIDTGSCRTFITTALKDKLNLCKADERKYSFVLGGTNISSYPYNINIIFNSNADNKYVLQARQVFEYSDPKGFGIDNVQILLGTDIIKETNLNLTGYTIGPKIT